ncbi:hypothetical protein PFAG_04175 [Plasmodium falciparum Santa Lucia]|uniref:Uncharacterized protein n=1 Tax=Plasmodium falciparum Santa Lucia TaxID=478859 RepID=W7G1C3_PLAFA|nr:hypothetical protein PFAG_04175 [Plasmodium falciparum Santa Lucia]
MKRYILDTSNRNYYIYDYFFRRKKTKSSLSVNLFYLSYKFSMHHNNEKEICKNYEDYKNHNIVLYLLNYNSMVSYILKQL